MELENVADRRVVRQGLRDEFTIRCATVEVVADTGAVVLVLPEDIVGPLRSEPLIGQFVLEALDLVADCGNRTLVPLQSRRTAPLKLK